MSERPDDLAELRDRLVERHKEKAFRERQITTAPVVRAFRDR